MPRHGALTARKYIQILQEVFVPFLEDHPATREAMRRGIMTFQQDGAGVHCTARVLRYLGHVFNGRVLSRKAHLYINSRRALEWSPYSCDLSPCDFYLFNQIKHGEEHSVYNDPFPTSIPMLKEKILVAMERLSEEQIRHAFQQIRRRAYAVVAAQGGHFNEDQIPPV